MCESLAKTYQQNVVVRYLHPHFDNELYLERSISALDDPFQVYIGEWTISSLFVFDPVLDLCQDKIVCRPRQTLKIVRSILSLVFDPCTSDFERQNFERRIAAQFLHEEGLTATEVVANVQS
jgi:hypothetical protein